MAERLVFRTVIELLGKPKEHVDKTIRDYVQKIKQDKDYRVLKADFADIKKRDKEELWMVFAELEVETKKLEAISKFCFDYMPSIIEIIEPKELHFSDGQFSSLLNDLQSKLHAIDLIAKEAMAKLDQVEVNMAKLLKNYILVLLGAGPRTAQQLAQLTGVPQNRLEDYLDHLIDDKKVDLKGERYSLASAQ